MCDVPKTCFLLAQVPQSIHMAPCQHAWVHPQALCQSRYVGTPLLLLPSIHKVSINLGHILIISWTHVKETQNWVSVLGPGVDCIGSVAAMLGDIHHSVMPCDAARSLAICISVCAAVQALHESFCTVLRSGFRTGMDFHRRQQLLVFDCQHILFEVLAHMLHFFDTFWMQVAGQVNAVLEGVGPFVDPGVSLLCFLSCKLEDALELLNIVHAFLCWPSGAMPCHPVSELRLTGLMPG